MFERSRGLFTSAVLGVGLFAPGCDRDGKSTQEMAASLPKEVVVVSLDVHNIGYDVKQSEWRLEATYPDSVDSQLVRSAATFKSGINQEPIRFLHLDSPSEPTVYLGSNPDDFSKASFNVVIGGGSDLLVENTVKASATRYSDGITQVVFTLVDDSKAR